MHSAVTNAFEHRIYVDKTDSRGRALLRTQGDFNPLASQLWRLVSGLEASWDVVLDIGSNYGEMLAGADLSGAKRIIAFEPNQQILPSLRRTVAELPWHVDVRAVAVGSRSDKVRFFSDRSWSGKSHVEANTTISEGDELVDMTSIDEVLQNDRFGTAIVKIDVEGLELDVLEGMHTFVKQTPLVVVMLEILHMSVQQVSVLTRSHAVFLMTSDGSGLVRLPTDDPMAAGVILHDGSTHRENAVLVLGSDAEGYLGRTPALQRTALPGPSPEARDLRRRLRNRERELRELRAFSQRKSVRAVTKVIDKLSGLNARRRHTR